MRLLIVACVVVATGRARAEPVRVAIECEGEGRTKACPAFLLSFLDATPQLLLPSPRAGADVIVYASATQVALIDRLHLRFVARMPGVPPVVELDVDLDSRADDDTQRARLEPAFRRGLALFVAARHPEAVAVTFAAPAETVAKAPADTTPWGVSATTEVTADYRAEYQAYSGYLELALQRITATSRLRVASSGYGAINRAPPLVTEEGALISLDTEQWNYGGNGTFAWLRDGRWSFGGAAGGFVHDPKAQYRYTTYAKGGVELDRYSAADPRGNRLALLYTLGYVAERYNIRNVRGERFAHYPTHELIASGTVRQDRVSIGLSVSLNAQLFRPLVRHNISASPSLSWQIGDRVDVALSFTATKREFPEPDPDEIDPTDFEQLQRLSYTAPFSLSGSLNLTVHWDPTNGARNDRFSDI